MSLYGAIIGDIAGSRYEFIGEPAEDFNFFEKDNHLTDDSVMTIAVAKACKEWYEQKHKYENGEVDAKDCKFLDEYIVKEMRDIGNIFPDAGYGGTFATWLATPGMKAYGSWGNGSAMRVSGVPTVFKNESADFIMWAAEQSAIVTHNHPEGIKGAQCAAGVAWIGYNGGSLEKAKEFATSMGYNLSWSYKDIKEKRADWYRECIPDTQVKVMRSKKIFFDESCQGTLPLALSALFDSSSYEECIRKAVLLQGDTDTTAAIAGGMAEAFFEIPQEMKDKADIKIGNLSHMLLDIVRSV